MILLLVIDTILLAWIIYRMETNTMPDQFQELTDAVSALGTDLHTFIDRTAAELKTAKDALAAMTTQDATDQANLKVANDALAAVQGHVDTATESVKALDALVKPAAPNP